MSTISHGSLTYSVVDTCQEHTGMGPNYLVTRHYQEHTGMGPNYLANKALPRIHKNGTQLPSNKALLLLKSGITKGYHHFREPTTNIDMWWLSFTHIQNNGGFKEEEASVTGNNHIPRRSAFSIPNTIYIGICSVALISHNRSPFVKLKTMKITSVR